MTYHTIDQSEHHVFHGSHYCMVTINFAYPRGISSGLCFLSIPTILREPVPAALRLCFRKPLIDPDPGRSGHRRRLGLARSLKGVCGDHQLMVSSRVEHQSLQLAVAGSNPAPSTTDRFADPPMRDKLLSLHMKPKEGGALAGSAPEEAESARRCGAAGLSRLPGAA